MIISLIGDYHAEVEAHQAIPRALELAANALELNVEHEWIRSTRADTGELRETAA